MNVDLEKELSGNKIDFHKINGEYIVDIDGSNLIVRMKGNILSMFFNVENSDRTIDIELKINNQETYIDSMEFLFIFISFLTDMKDDIEELTNRELEQRISLTLKEFNFKNVVKVEVTGTDVLSFELSEKPLTQNDIKTQLIDIEEHLHKALMDDNEKAYNYYQQKYQELKKLLKESNSFKYLKSFKKFFD